MCDRRPANQVFDCLLVHCEHRRPRRSDALRGAYHGLLGVII